MTQLHNEEKSETRRRLSKYDAHCSIDKSNSISDVIGALSVPYCLQTSAHQTSLKHISSSRSTNTCSVPLMQRRLMNND